MLVLSSVVAAVAISLLFISWLTLRELRAESRTAATALRQEVTAVIGTLGSTLRAEGDSSSQRVVAQVVDMRRTVDERLKEIAAGNARELEAMRVTVDEKLQGTLTQRLGESFTLVTQRLEEVHRGLGEMQMLATGVGDLKKILSSVRSRGVWGEVQLGALLEQMLSPEQFERNVVTKESSREAVEFAVRFPGRGEIPLLLPIDAKFPIEDYQQLVDAIDHTDAAAADAAARRLEVSVRNSAKTIAEKYVNPPVTTDFAILFLPMEGLYAEVLRRPGLAERIQKDHKVLIAGPTTLTAILIGLQMGFRTLAIEKRSSEVWRLLEAVKTEFMKFGGVIEKVNRNLEAARNHMDSLGTRSRVVSRKLKDVQELPESDAKLLLNLPDVDDDEDAWVDPSKAFDPEATA